jgi:hypothetical protein
VVTPGGGEKSLLCVNAKTHDKVCVCRAPGKNARQNLCLLCANAKTHDKHFFDRAFFFAVHL